MLLDEKRCQFHCTNMNIDDYHNQNGGVFRLSHCCLLFGPCIHVRTPESTMYSMLQALCKAHFTLCRFKLRMKLFQLFVLPQLRIIYEPYVCCTTQWAPKFKLSHTLHCNVVPRKFVASEFYSELDFLLIENAPKTISINYGRLINWNALHEDLWLTEFQQTQIFCVCLLKCHSFCLHFKVFAF